MTKKQILIFLLVMAFCLVFAFGFNKPAFASEIQGVIQSNQGGSVTNNDSGYQKYVNSLPKSGQNGQPQEKNQTLLPDIILIGSLIGAIFMFVAAVSFK